METPDAYQLEKWIWTDADFSQMGWHDAAIYTWRCANAGLALDIDYIFQWNAPEVEGTSFTFWVAPATLVFHGVGNVEFDFDFINAESWKTDAVEIENIKREENGDWVIQLQNGYIGFSAAGFTQYIRRAPSFEFSQQVSYPHRAGTSLEKSTGELRTDGFDFAEFRKTEMWRLYQLMLDQARVKLQLDVLLDERATGKIDLKNFLQQKRDLQDKINYLGIELRGTRFSRE